MSSRGPAAGGSETPLPIADLGSTDSGPEQWFAPLTQSVHRDGPSPAYSSRTLLESELGANEMGA